uniref:sphingomyelin phosphodiesterase n=1 Tax=Dromaius novaehollandiae TaxID=8790 RepID=A0A8C4KEH8_DRONO
MEEGPALQLRVFNLNCWAIRYLSKRRQERVQLVGDTLRREGFDLVLLQEVWSEWDYSVLKEKLGGCHPFSHYFRSGVIGSGLCVFSRFPILDAFLYRYSLNGYPYMLQHGDWFCGKSVGLVVIKISGIVFNVYVTHLHAEYCREKDAYLPHRVVQAWELDDLPPAPALLTLLRRPAGLCSGALLLPRFLGHRLRGRLLHCVLLPGAGRILRCRRRLPQGCRRRHRGAGEPWLSGCCLLGGRARAPRVRGRGSAGSILGQRRQQRVMQRGAVLEQPPAPFGAQHAGSALPPPISPSVVCGYSPHRAAPGAPPGAAPCRGDWGSEASSRNDLGTQSCVAG